MPARKRNRKGAGADTGNAGHFASVSRSETKPEKTNAERFPALADVDLDAEQTQKWMADFDAKVNDVHQSLTDVGSRMRWDRRTYKSSGRSEEQWGSYSDSMDHHEDLYERLSQMRKFYGENPWRRVIISDGRAHLTGYGTTYNEVPCSKGSDGKEQYILPEFSGVDDDVIASKAGERACPRCFAGLEVDYEARSGLRDEEREAAKAKERRARNRELTKMGLKNLA